MPRLQDPTDAKDLLVELDLRGLTGYQIGALTVTDSGQWYRRKLGKLGMGISAAVRLVRALYGKNPELAVWFLSKLFGIALELKKDEPEEMGATAPAST